MNCKEFEAAALEFVRGDMTQAPAQQDILAHARTCAPCARRLGSERLLSSVVAAVIAHDRERRAPQRVENVVVTAFRERHKYKPSPRVKMTRVIVGAMAAGLILGAVMTLRRAEKPNVVAIEPVLPVPAPVIAPVYREAKRRLPRTLRSEGRMQPNRKLASVPR